MFFQGTPSNINFTNIDIDGAKVLWEEQVPGSVYAQNVVAKNVQESIWNCGM
jgi:hypothetical protein